MGPPGTGELNEPLIGQPGYTAPYTLPPPPAPEVLPEPVAEPELIELPELLVTPPRVPPRPAAPVGNDPIMPPNWSDLLDFNTRFPGQPYIPLPGWSDSPFPVGPLRLTDDPVSAPGLPSVVPDLWPPEVPIGEPFQAPLPNPAADPLLPAPWSIPTPGPSVLADPFQLPEPTASPTPSPTPGPSPRADPAPVNPPEFFDPLPLAPAVPGIPFLTPLLPDLEPEVQLQPRPTEANPCNCPQVTDAPEKKKPKKERPPRSVCYRGTYVQNSRGISYNPREQVPCNPKERAKSPRKKRVSTRLEDYLPF